MTKPHGWTIPTLREIATEPTRLGIWRHHLGFVIFLGVCPSFFLIATMIIAGARPSILTYALAVAMAAISMAGVLTAIRHLHKANPYWLEALTSHRVPATRYRGR